MNPAALNNISFHFLLYIAGAIITLINGVFLVMITNWMRKADRRREEEEADRRDLRERLVRIDEKLGGLTELRLRTEGHHGRIRHNEDKILDMQHRLKTAEGRIQNLNRFCQSRHGQHLDLDSDE